MGMGKTVMDQLGSFLTTLKGDQKAELSANIMTKEMFEEVLRLDILSEMGIPFYEHRKFFVLSSSWSINGISRQQAVEVAKTVREGDSGIEIEGKSIRPIEEEINE